MASNKPPCKTEWTKTKLRMRFFSANLLAVTTLALLPYISTLTLPSGDPAPGRSPGPPDSELYSTIDTVANRSDVTTDEVTEMSEIADACAFARVPSESESVVTLSETDSEVNLTVSHAVFETENLVRGVVYEVFGVCHNIEDWPISSEDVDDIFSSIIGPVFKMNTPHPVFNYTGALGAKTSNARNFQTFNPLELDALLLPRARRYNLRTLKDEVNVEDLNPQSLNPQSRNPKSQNPKSLNPESFNPGSLSPQTFNPRPLTINYAISSTSRTPKAPIPYLLNKTSKEKDLTTNKLLDFIHETTLENILQRPDEGLPNFEIDMFNLTTRRFNLIETGYKTRDNEKNSARRQNKLIHRGVLWDTALKVVRYRLETMKQDYGIYDGPSASLVDWVGEKYYNDRRAIRRVLLLMQQIVYETQGKFLYAQLLKEKYKDNVNYRIGYTYAVLENLRHQFYSGYDAMKQYMPKPKLAGLQSTEDKLMYQLSVYEKILRIQVEIDDVVHFLKRIVKEKSWAIRRGKLNHTNSLSF